jgi:hypothetical protein
MHFLFGALLLGVLYLGRYLIFRLALLGISLLIFWHLTVGG